MHKITQKELLSEGFWNQFASIGRQAKDQIKSFGNLVAPEIADPLNKGIDWLRNTRKSRKRAGLSIEELIKEELIANGYFPYKGEEGKIRWARNKAGTLKKNTDDTNTGSIQVGAVGYDDKGQPYMEAEYSDPLKRNVTFTIHPKTREFKIINHPFRNLKVEKPDDDQSQNNQSPIP